MVKATREEAGGEEVEEREGEGVGEEDVSRVADGGEEADEAEGTACGGEDADRDGALGSGGERAAAGRGGCRGECDWPAQRSAPTPLRFSLSSCPSAGSASLSYSLALVRPSSSLASSSNSRRARA